MATKVDEAAESTPAQARKKMATNRGRAKSKRGSGKTGSLMKTAAKVGVAALTTAAEAALVKAAAGKVGKSSKKASRSKSLNIQAPEFLAAALGYLGDHEKIALLRNAEGEPVAGLVTYKWLKRHVSKKKLESLETPAKSSDSKGKKKAAKKK